MFGDIRERKADRQGIQELERDKEVRVLMLVEVLHHEGRGLTC